ncbi:MAG TPA: hypothetical protein VK444_06245, partial [Methanobacteriaceae archaeon]|nr:hypothetical protein [Methanobacteriaceae archaeon]
MKKKLYLLEGQPVSKFVVDDYQSRLEVVCRLVNSRYQKHLHTGLTPLPNLKVRAIFLNISRAYDLLDTVLKGLYPQTMRFVLLHDYLENLDDVMNLEGTALKKSAQLMIQLEHNNLLFEMSADREETDLALSGLVNSLQLLKQELSPKKRRIISEYVKTGKQSQAALNLGMTQQGVSKALKSSNWEQIRDGEKKLKRAFEIYAARLGKKQSSLDD